MAKWGGIIGSALAGAAVAGGAALVEGIKSEQKKQDELSIREAQSRLDEARMKTLAELQHKQSLETQGRAQTFQREERLGGQEFTAEQNNLREQGMDRRQGQQLEATAREGDLNRQNQSQIAEGNNRTSRENNRETNETSRQNAREATERAEKAVAARGRDEAIRAAENDVKAADAALKQARDLASKAMGTDKARAEQAVLTARQELVAAQQRRARAIANAKGGSEGGAAALARYLSTDQPSGGAMTGNEE